MGTAPEAVVSNGIEWRGSVFDFLVAIHGQICQSEQNGLKHQLAWKFRALVGEVVRGRLDWIPRKYIGCAIQRKKRF